MEPSEAASDLVGRTSARLLAAGVDRNERLDALHLLAILDASIDTTGRVRRPLDDLAGEFELEPLSVLRSLDHLEASGAVKRDGAGVVLLGSNANALGGMHLADFLEDVRASFDGPRPASRRAPWLVRGGAVLVASAAALMVLTIAPQQTVQPVTLRDASTTTTAAAGVVDDATVALPDIDTDIQPTTTIVASAPTPVVETTLVAAGDEPCPTAQPVADLVDGLIRITNPSDEDMMISALTVGGATIDQIIAVPAGETVLKDIGAVVAPTDVGIASWDWSKDSVARRCPS